MWNFKKRDSRQVESAGRWWIVYPLTIGQLVAAVWIGLQWYPFAELTLAIMTPAIALFFPIVFLSLHGPEKLREWRGIGLLLTNFGLLVMAIGGLLKALVGGLQDNITGVSAALCGCGLCWLLLWIALRCAGAGWAATRLESHDAAD